MGVYLFVRKHLPTDYRRLFIQSAGPLAALRAQCVAAGFTDAQGISVLNYLLSEQNKLVKGRLKPDQISWSATAPYWIGAEEGFIAFVSKPTNKDAEAAEDGAEEHVELEEKLIAALVNWRPTPSQLLFSKIRTKIESVGIKAEMDSIGDKLIHAHWFADILSHSDAERRSLIDRTIEHYFDQVQDLVAGDASLYFGDMCEKYWGPEDRKR